MSERPNVRQRESERRKLIASERAQVRGEGKQGKLKSPTSIQPTFIWLFIKILKNGKKTYENLILACGQERLTLLMLYTPFTLGTIHKTAVLAPREKSVFFGNDLSNNVQNSVWKTNENVNREINTLFWYKVRHSFTEIHAQFSFKKEKHKLRNNIEETRMR